jgi:hypothetical protein
VNRARLLVALALGLALGWTVSCGCFPSCPTGNGGCSGFPLVACPNDEFAATGPDCNFCCIEGGKSCTTGDAGDPCCSGSCGDAGLCACGKIDTPCHSASDCCSGSCVLDACAALDGGVDAG